MKISRKKLNRLIDERIEHHLRRRKKKEQELRKRLDEVYALVDDITDRPRPPERRKRFEEYDD